MTSWPWGAHHWSKSRSVYKGSNIVWQGYMTLFPLQRAHDELASLQQQSVPPPTTAPPPLSSPQHQPLQQQPNSAIPSTSTLSPPTTFQPSPPSFPTPEVCSVNLAEYCHTVLIPSYLLLRTKLLWGLPKLPTWTLNGAKSEWKNHLHPPFIHLCTLSPDVWWKTSGTSTKQSRPSPSWMWATLLVCVVPVATMLSVISRARERYHKKLLNEHHHYILHDFFFHTTVVCTLCSRI